MAGPTDQTDAPQDDRHEAFLARRGGPIGTGGRGVVALRWDHHTDVAAPLVELHRRHGLPWTWAHYSQQREVPGQGLAWETIQQHALADGGEPWAHSRTHTDATTEDGLTEEIVLAREELQTSLPGCVIEGFVVAGVGGTGWLGFTPTTSLEYFTDTVAGRLVLDTYAVSTGHIQPVHRELTGTIRQGLPHSTIESRTAADVIPLIEQARDTATGIALMLHPHRIDQPGRLSLADYAEIVAFVAAERDAGRLLALTLSGLTVADSSHDRRHDLVVNGSFEDGVAGWEAQGWDVQTGRVPGLPPDAVSATTTDVGATLTQTVAGDDLAPYRGGTRELVVPVWARGRRGSPPHLRVQVNDVIDRVVPVPPGSRAPLVVRLPHVLDRRRDSHTLRLTKTDDDGRLFVHGVGLLAL